MPPDWWPDWSGQTCVIVASGPSAKDADLAQAMGRAKVIVINSSWQLAPWADVLYGCDFAWWRVNEGVPKFAGLKISQDPKAVRFFPGVHLVKTTRPGYDSPSILLTQDAGTIGHGGHGGFQAVNLAAQFGPPSKIILVGFDMRTDLGVHWHGKHTGGLNNPNARQVGRWREAFDSIAPSLAGLGILVINASPISALTAYQKMTLQEALA